MDILRKNIHIPTLSAVVAYGVWKISNGINDGTMVGMAEILGNTLGIFIGGTIISIIVKQIKK
jgi:hypothetical protein